MGVDGDDHALPLLCVWMFLTIGSKEGEIRRVFSDPEKGRVMGIYV